MLLTDSWALGHVPYAPADPAITIPRGSAPRDLGQGIFIKSILGFDSTFHVTSQALRNPCVHDLEHSQSAGVPCLGAPFCTCTRNFRRASPAVRTRGSGLRNLVRAGGTRSRWRETKTQTDSHKGPIMHLVVRRTRATAGWDRPCCYRAQAIV